MSGTLLVVFLLVALLPPIRAALARRRATAHPDTASQDTKEFV